MLIGKVTNLAETNTFNLLVTETVKEHGKYQTIKSEFICLANDENSLLMDRIGKLKEGDEIAIDGRIIMFDDDRCCIKVYDLFIINH